MAGGIRYLAKYFYETYNIILRQMIYGSGATISYTYDIHKRLTKALHSDGTIYSYTYNGTKYYYITNQTGDVVQILSASGGSDPILGVVTVLGGVFATGYLLFNDITVVVVMDDALIPASVGCIFTGIDMFGINYICDCGESWG